MARQDKTCLAVSNSVLGFPVLFLFYSCGIVLYRTFTHTENNVLRRMSAIIVRDRYRITLTCGSDGTRSISAWGPITHTPEDIASHAYEREHAASQSRLRSPVFLPDLPVKRLRSLAWLHFSSRLRFSWVKVEFNGELDRCNNNNNNNNASIHALGWSMTHHARSVPSGRRLDSRLELSTLLLSYC